MSLALLSRVSLLSGRKALGCSVRRIGGVTPEQFDKSASRFMAYKRLVTVTVCSFTALGCLWLRRKKAQRLEDNLRDCVNVPLDEELFEASTTLYRYKGYNFPGQIVQSGVLQELPEFEFREDDVLVASFPKTGTTWVQEIVYMLTHGCKPSLESDENLETRFPYLEYPYPGIKSVSKMKGQRCIKTHLPLPLLPPSVHSAGSKIIYVTRNPRDTAVSYYYFMKLLPSSGFKGNFRDFHNYFIQDKVPYGPFMDHVRSYWQEQSNPAILCVSYEELTQDPALVVKKIAQHLQITVSEDLVHHVVGCTSFSSMAKNPSVNYEHWKELGFARTDRGNFLRKGVVGDWQRHMSPKMIGEFEAWEAQRRLVGDPKFIYSLS